MPDAALFDDPLTLFRTLSFAAAGSLLWLEYWDLKDRRRPEPRGRLLLAFAIGMGSALLALGVYRLLGLFGVSAEPGGSVLREFVVCMLLVGPVEELCKFGCARLTVFRWRTFDERVDGFVYAAAVALGFAAFENFFYLPTLGVGGQIVRTLCAPLVHTLFAAIWGWGTAYAFLEARAGAPRFLWQAGTVALAAVVHGLYDFFVFTGAPSTGVAAFVLVLWGSVIVAARRSARIDHRRGGRG